MTAGVSHVGSKPGSGRCDDCTGSASGLLPTSSSQSSRHCLSASRQPHRELGEVTDFAINCDGAAVLLRYDLVADRQPEPGALACWLGREERLEQLVPVFRWNTDAIVTHPDLDASVEPAGRDLQCRAVSSVALAAPLVGGIEAVAYEVEEHAPLTWRVVAVLRGPDNFASTNDPCITRAESYLFQTPL